MASDSSAGGVDFTGYYRLTKTDHLDEYLKAQSHSWVVRKLCSKYGTRATDIVRQTGQSLSVVTLNAKGVWSRRSLVGKEVTQPNAAGVMCKTTAWWEGRVHKSRMVSKEGEAWESWRYVEGGVMVVKSIYTASDGSQGYMYWYFEEIKVPHGSGEAADQRRALRVAASDTTRLQRLAAARSKWETPADHVIRAAASSAADSPRKGASGAASPLSNISPQNSGVLGSSLPATRAPSGVAPAPPPPSEASQTREAQVDAAKSESAASEVGMERDSGSRPEIGMLKSPSSESMNALASADAEFSASGSMAGGKSGTSSAETLLSFLVAEFGDGRSIAAVVPFRARLAALEPELLALSPEQAEDTQLKLSELEDQIGRASQARARHSSGWRCLFCTCVCHRYLIPDYLRSWDL